MHAGIEKLPTIRQADSKVSSKKDDFQVAPSELFCSTLPFSTVAGDPPPGHLTVTALGKHLSPGEIKKYATQHTTIRRLIGTFM